MMDVHFSKHAAQRFAQRGFNNRIIDILLEFGTVKRRRKADVYFMDHAGRNRACDQLGRKLYAKFERKLDSYLVVGEGGMIITCAKRLGRL